MAKTAYLFDERFTKHDTGMGHPERSDRVLTIHEKVLNSGFYHKLVKVRPRKATKANISLIHAPHYPVRVKYQIDHNIHYLDAMDTPVGKFSYDTALLAAGSCLAMADAVMKGRAECGFCNIRPPGHHAEKESAGGFCIFNNVAITAEYLLVNYPVKRVAILDWDAHHGNGTQHAFEEDNSVFFISFHQYPHYPGTGSVRERGTGSGKGSTLNIPMGSGSGDMDYLRQFKTKVLPSLDAFQPDIILVSAGFDAHQDDPLSGLNLSTKVYYTFTMLLGEIAKKHAASRIIAILEGGYNLEALSDSAVMVIRALFEI